MDISIRPCVKTGQIKSIAFIINRDDDHVWVLDNYVWAVAVKQFAVTDFNNNFRAIVVPEEKLTKILAGLVNYALYAGMTPEAAEHLPLLTPMTKANIALATAKGEETLARHKTQAAAEEAADKKRPLAGAALKAKLAKEERERFATVDRTADGPGDVFVEAGTANNAVEPGGTADAQPDPPPNPGTAVGRRRAAKRAIKATKLAEELTTELTEAEAAGVNPNEIVNPTSGKRGRITRAINADKKEEAELRARARPFDPASLKGADDKYKSVSAMFKALLFEGKMTDDKIFAAVQKQFSLDDSKRSYIAWNRNWLKKQGLIK